MSEDRGVFFSFKIAMIPRLRQVFCKKTFPTLSLATVLNYAPDRIKKDIHDSLVVMISWDPHTHLMIKNKTNLKGKPGELFHDVKQDPYGTPLTYIKSLKEIYGSCPAELGD